MAEISVAFLSPAFFCLLDTGPGDDGSPFFIGQATNATRSAARATDTNKEG